MNKSKNKYSLKNKLMIIILGTVLPLSLIHI